MTAEESHREMLKNRRYNDADIEELANNFYKNGCYAFAESYAEKYHKAKLKEMENNADLLTDKEIVKTSIDYYDVSDKTGVRYRIPKHVPEIKGFYHGAMWARRRIKALLRDKEE